MSNLRLHAYSSKVSQCDEPQKVYGVDDQPEFMENIQENITISRDLTLDVTDLPFPSTLNTCGKIEIVFVLTNSAQSRIYDTRSRSVQIDCQKMGNIGDVKIDVISGSPSTSIPIAQVGDRNPFGINATVKVSIGSCGAPQTMACLYCGFDDNVVGVDNETWNQWQTQEVIKAQV